MHLYAFRDLACAAGYRLAVIRIASTNSFLQLRCVCYGCGVYGVYIPFGLSGLALPLEILALIIFNPATDTIYTFLPPSSASAMAAHSYYAFCIALSSRSALRV
jgi:hypothetical protein